MTEPPASDAKADTILGSVHTANFADLLRRVDSCLMVSTFQAGKLVILRPDGAAINTHYRDFGRPMGLWANRERLVLGAQREIVDFYNLPDVATHLHDPARHDAVYMARSAHVTGAIDIHELACDIQGRIWFVNTLFSCLCTLDARTSFAPRWRPPFISHYAPEDRCHLNGLAMRDGSPRYLTALGESNVVEGWRANKRDGGILLDCSSSAIVARGLSMPHSPRWYRGRLWLLESGRGALVTIDPDTGRKTDIARVPGFARGLDFIGAIAFIGLSQLRQSNAFTDIPITDDNADRQSGVWAVDTETGQTLAFLKFTGAVEEIFAVQAIAGVLFPEIVHDGELLLTCYELSPRILSEVAVAGESAPAAAKRGSEVAPEVLA